MSKRIIREQYTGPDFAVQSEMTVDTAGVCPLFDGDGNALGELAGLTRINCKLDERWPESFVDQGNGAYFRVANDGVEYGTSVVGCAGFRTLAENHLIPDPERLTISGDPVSVTFMAEGTFREKEKSLAVSRSTRRWHCPEEGRGPVRVDLSATLEVYEKIALSTACDALGRDRFRWFMLSSMYVNDVTYDSNLLRFEDAEGKIHEISFSNFLNVNNGNHRHGHLFETPVPLGSWIELVKTSGSTWLPQSPTIRYDMIEAGGMQLGVQGWWSGSDNPHDDNLNVWLEWMDVPDVLLSGTHLRLDVCVTSLPYRDQKVAVSRSAWPQRMWWRPRDYSHEMQ